MQKNTIRRRGSRTLVRLVSLLLLLSAIILFSNCQTPPKKTNKTGLNRSAGAEHGQAATENAFDLFSTSAERFGSDPRISRPLLVSDTVWIVVVGSVFLIGAAAVVSSIRGSRTGRPRRRA